MKNSKSNLSKDDTNFEIEELIQFLIDGDLDHESRRKLLLNIDSDQSEYWRYAALGFVEQQILSETLADDGSIQSIDPARQITQRASYTARHWALAACLTFSLVAGGWWMGSQSGTTPLNAELLATKTTSDPAAANTLNRQSASNSEDKPFAMNVPVYDATKDGNAALTQLNASADSLRKAQDLLHQRGYTTSTNTQFLTANLKDGRQLVVPVNHIVFQQNPELSNTQQPEL